MLRKTDSIPAGDILIEDIKMEPYFITKSQTGGFVVYERVKRGEKGNNYLRTVCYPSTFSSALRVVSREILNTKSKTHYSSVKEYIQAWEQVQKKMESITTL